MLEIRDLREKRGAGSSRKCKVAVAVVCGHRAQWIGRALMEALHARARAQGVVRISLSVDADNAAKRLYEWLVHVDYAPEDEDGRMILDLA
jgi:GNAT superfamily N-acetyltransferase